MFPLQKFALAISAAVTVAGASMRILMVTPRLDGSDPTVELLHLAHALHSASWHVELLALAGGSSSLATTASTRTALITNITHDVTLTVVQPDAERFCMGVTRSKVGGGSAAADAAMLVDPQAYDVILAHGASLDQPVGAMWLQEQVEMFGAAFTQRLVWWILEPPLGLQVQDGNFAMLTQHLRKHLVFTSECVVARWRRLLDRHLAEVKAEFPKTATGDSQHWHVIHPTLSFAAIAETANTSRRVERAAARRSLGVPDTAYTLLFVNSTSGPPGLPPVLQAIDEACATSMVDSSTSSSSSTRTPDTVAAAAAAAADRCPTLLFAYDTAAVAAAAVPQLKAAVAGALRALPPSNVQLIQLSGADVLSQLFAAVDAYIANPRCSDLGPHTLQAMALGLPVIGCACGATTEPVEALPFHNDTEDVAYLARHITQMDPRLPEALQRLDRATAAGRELLRGKFAPLRQLAAWEALLSRVSRSSRQHDREVLRDSSTRWFGDQNVGGVPSMRTKQRKVADVPKYMMPSAHAFARLRLLLSKSDALSAALGARATDADNPATAAATAATAAAAVGAASAVPPATGAAAKATMWTAPVTWRWRRQSDAPFGVMDASKAVVGQWLYVWGGFVKYDMNVTNRALWRLDMGLQEAARWTEVKTPLPADLGREHGAVAVHLKRYIYVVGGQPGDLCTPATSSAYRFDANTVRWQPLPPLPSRVYGGKAVIINNVLRVFRATAGRGATQGIPELSLLLPADGSLPAGPWRQADAGAYFTFHSTVAVVNRSGEPTIIDFGGALDDIKAKDASAGRFDCNPVSYDQLAAPYPARTLTKRQDAESGGTTEVWELEPRATFPVGLSEVESCTIVLPGGRVVLFLGGTHYFSWLSRAVYAYHAGSRTIAAVGLLPQGRMKGAVCGLWNGTLWMAAGQQGKINAQGCMLNSRANIVLREVWTTLLPPELLAQ